jgi:hypothetical protein
MSNAILIDLFVEDRAHEEFLKALLERLAYEKRKGINIRIRSARGGHGRALKEFSLYQASVLKGFVGMTMPDLLVIAIDTNCKPLHKAKREIESIIHVNYKDRVILACPDPHIERWYVADPDSLKGIIGVRPVVGRKKCKRDYYKTVLSKALISAGYPTTLGGIEFAREIVQAMDLYRAAKTERSLKLFLDDANAKLTSC